MAELITASRGIAHITPKQDAVWHRGLVGSEDCILKFGECLAPALVPSQPTNIRILDGCGMMQGRFFEVESGSYDTVSIPNGAQGYNRLDYVCAKITQNENGTQEFSWQVVSGQQTTGTPQPPTIEEHSLDDGDSYALMPVASVLLNGVTLSAVNTVAQMNRLPEATVEELIWENASPFTAIGAVTITDEQLISPTMHISNYDEIIIETCASTAAHWTISNRVTKGNYYHNAHAITNPAAYISIGFRAGAFNDNSITWDSGVFQNSNAARTTNNGYAIPQRIYGIRKVGA